MAEEAKAQAATSPASSDSPTQHTEAVDAGGNDAQDAVATEDKMADAEAKADTKDTEPAADANASVEERKEDATENAPNSGEDLKASKEEPEETGDVAADGSTADATAETPASTSKSKARRKSSGVPEHKNKRLNKKASKAKFSHTDAKPGDHFFIRLKGYPLWPGIICDEEMLPDSLKSHRPVTAAREDGSYREGYEDGGKKVLERTFPVMYLFTNEFGYIPNYDLVPLDFEEVAKVDSKIRKDLYQAHQLAAEKHDLDYYKAILRDFEEAKAAEEEARVAAEEAKAAAKAAKETAKSASKPKKKSKSAAEPADADNDVEMGEADGDLVVDEEDGEKKPKSSKKRKAVAEPEETSTPQASGAKKLKFKPLTNSTPKPANGTTPKSSAKDSTTKTPKSKSKKAAANGNAKEEAPVTPKEPELTPEEKHAKKEKEILFLRHKIQKGFLTRDQQPKEEEMKQMSEFISKLEGYSDLEVSIIRQTKINKVLKAILKLSEIPKEADFKFKERSRSLLEKWNKILESSEQPAASATPAPGDDEKKVTNGVEKSAKSEEKADEKSDEKTGEAVTKTTENEEAKTTEDVAMDDTSAEDAPVENSAEAEATKQTGEEATAVEADA